MKNFAVTLLVALTSLQCFSRTAKSGTREIELGDQLAYIAATKLYCGKFAVVDEAKLKAFEMEIQNVPNGKANEDVVMTYNMRADELEGMAAVSKEKNYVGLCSYLSVSLGDALGQRNPFTFELNEKTK